MEILKAGRNIEFNKRMIERPERINYEPAMYIYRINSASCV